MGMYVTNIVTFLERTWSIAASAAAGAAAYHNATLILNTSTTASDAVVGVHAHGDGHGTGWPETPVACTLFYGQVAFNYAALATVFVALTCSKKLRKMDSHGRIGLVLAAVFTMLTVSVNWIAALGSEASSFGFMQGVLDLTYLVPVIFFSIDFTASCFDLYVPVIANIPFVIAIAAATSLHEFAEASEWMQHGAGEPIHPFLVGLFEVIVAIQVCKMGVQRTWTLLKRKKKEQEEAQRVHSSV